MASVAVLGTGHMGTPIARRLLAAGHQVTVWNRTAARAAPLSGAGARVAFTPARAADGADVVIIMLTDATAVEAVLFGGPLSDGSAQHDVTAVLRPGACLVQMSTSSPDEVRALAGRLPRGVAFVDGPVGGSVGAARAGTLTIFAAGQDAAIARAKPVLQALGTVRQCGDVGEYYPRPLIRKQTWQPSSARSPDEADPRQPGDGLRAVRRPLRPCRPRRP